MPSIVIYGPRGGSSFRPHWMLAELGLSYESTKVDMAAGDHKKPEYLAINPAGQVPAMSYDGFILTESAAICRYLAEKHDPSFLGETPEERATALRWELFVLLDIDKNLLPFAFRKWGRQVGEATLAHAQAELDRYLPVLEGRLAAQPYLAGGRFTVADVVARSSFRYAETGDVDLSSYPSVAAWMKRCEERPAFAAASKE